MKQIHDDSRPIDAAALSIVRDLHRAGFVAWWVGGCVRDMLLNRPIKDIDIATNARLEDLTRMFDDVKLVGASFGVCLVSRNGFQFEVATFRRDGKYVDFRHPESVEFGTPKEDARRRDFTINALYYDPNSGEIHDFVNGGPDLEAGIIRAVGNPQARFSEDALRLLRAIRFAARLGFEIERFTWNAMEELASLVTHVSPERQCAELTTILCDPKPSRGLQLMDQCGLLALLLPEISAMKGVRQGSDFHPEGDVFVHTMLCIDNLELRTPVAAWAMLLHDVAKPVTFQETDGRITFYGHESIGAEMAERICGRFKMSNDDTRRICDIVARHMRFIACREWNRSTMRRFLAADTIVEDLAVHKSDCLSSFGGLSGWEHVTGALEELRAHQEPALPPPLITGNDLITMGFKPGPLFKEILEAVQTRQLEGELKTREEATAFVVSDYKHG